MLARNYLNLRCRVLTQSRHVDHVAACNGSIGSGRKLIQKSAFRCQEEEAQFICEWAVPIQQAFRKRQIDFRVERTADFLVLSHDFQLT